MYTYIYTYSLSLRFSRNKHMYVALTDTQHSMYNNNVKTKTRKEVREKQSGLEDKKKGLI